MDVLIITFLVSASVALFLIELFLIPGISVAGIMAGGCIVYANIYAFSHLGYAGGYITLILSVIAGIVSVILFMRSKTLDKIALKQNIDSTVERKDASKVKVGDTGVTTTRLALIGYAEINGTIVEVKSTADFMDAKTPVKVVRITDGILLVEKTNH